MTKGTILAILAAVSLSMCGCASSKVVPDPSGITLEAAMQSVGDGLKAMKIAQGDIKTGLLPSEVTVTFNVTATGSDNAKLVLTASTPSTPQLPISGNVSGEVGRAIEATRGNVITIKFTNLLYAPQNQLITMKSGQQIDSILKALEGHLITIYK